MLELKNNKHNTYYHCTYLYIVNAVIFKLLLTSYLKRDLAKKNNNNVTTLICLAISVRAKVLRDPLFNILKVWIDIMLAILTNLLFWQGAGQYWNTCCVPIHLLILCTKSMYSFCEEKVHTFEYVAE